MSRVSPASPLSSLLGREIDAANINSFCDETLGILEELLGGRATVHRRPELRLIATLIYYIVPLVMQSGITPGIDYCGLTAVESMPVVALIHSHVVPIQSYRYLRPRTAILVAVLYALEGYIRQRGTEISSHVSELAAILLSRDNQGGGQRRRHHEDRRELHSDHGQPRGREREQASSHRTQQNANDIQNEISSPPRTNNQHTIHANADTNSILKLVTHAITRTCASLTPTPSSKLIALSTLLYDLNLVAFFLHGSSSYVDPILRLSGVKLVTTRSSGRKRMGPVSTLPPLHYPISIYFYYISFHVICCINFL